MTDTERKKKGGNGMSGCREREMWRKETGEPVVYLATTHLTVSPPVNVTTFSL